MSDQKRIEELENYIRALEAQRDEYKKDLDQSLDVVQGILGILGIDPENMEGVKLRNVIKQGTSLFTGALMDSDAFAKKFSFTQVAVDLARKYPRK